ncbi:MAG TPA: hypothetical protein VLS90_14675 [Thermodesulfobacteriota bacterium]|nr:hypothetical protein [Thermodesulfobacteriota bacterium]
MKGRARGSKFFSLPWLSLLLVLTPACHQVAVDSLRQPGLHPRDLQPLALLPAPDPPGAPGLGSKLDDVLEDALSKKGYALVDGEVVTGALREMGVSPQQLISSRESLADFSRRVGARLLMIAAVPEFRMQKSYWGSQNVPPAEGGGSDKTQESLFLPTYFFGRSQITILLRMFEAETGNLVWMAEGKLQTYRARPQASAGRILENLLNEIPSASKEPPAAARKPSPASEEPEKKQTVP